MTKEPGKLSSGMQLGNEQVEENEIINSWDVEQNRMKGKENLNGNINK